MCVIKNISYFTPDMMMHTVTAPGGRLAEILLRVNIGTSESRKEAKCESSMPLCIQIQSEILHAQSLSKMPRLQAPRESTSKSP